MPELMRVEYAIMQGSDLVKEERAKDVKTQLYEFLDAQVMAMHHPTTFWAPSMEELSQLQVGDHIKVCRHDERFWVELTLVSLGSLQGKVANNLALQYDGLDFDDKLSVEFRHVLDYHTA